MALEPFKGEGFVHPLVGLTTQPGQGQGLVVTDHVSAGTILIVDHPIWNRPSNLSDNASTLEKTIAMKKAIDAT